MRGMKAVRLQVLGSLLLAIAGGALGASTAAAAEGPANTSAPAVSGIARDEQRLKASKGSWSGQKPISYAYAWSRCDPSGGSCTNIGGAGKSAYKLTHLDVGHTLRVTVTASNEAGHASATSEPSGVVAPSAPVKKAAPKISGLKEDGQLLSASTGLWKGTPPFSYSYRWEACDALGANCSAIAGATASSYRPVTSQIAGRLRVIVTAANSVGSASKVSAATAKIKPGPPVSIAAPAVSGSLQEGQTLTASTGGWAGSGPFAFSYQWLRCAISGGSCEQIPGATGPTYVEEAADFAHNLAVVVTASGSLGSASATSAETQGVLGILPTNSILPSISGLLQDGGLLSVATGSWSGTEPIAYAIQWQLCNALGEACEDLVGATGSSLKLDPSEIGKMLQAVVTATNAAGSTSATTSLTALIEGILPKNTALPSISGLLQDGGLLSVASGSWSGSEPISYAYQWQLCDALGEACEDLAGATGSGLKLDPSEIGKTLAVVVTATNAAGSTSATSSVTSLIEGILPKNTSLPSISGLLEDGQLLSVSNGSWEGSTPLSYAYQWQLCNSAGKECKNLGGATGSGLKLEPADVGKTLALVVTATNPAGSTSATSTVTNLILAILPKNTELPAISGLLKLGQTLSATTGKWSGSEPISYGYQWQLCLLGTCNNILAETKSTLALALGDVGGVIRVIVTATNSRGSTPAISKETKLIEGLGLNPIKGASGTNVTLSGAGVSAATQVNFGSEPASEVEVNSPTEITATAPAGSGTVPVTVETPEGSSNPTPSAQFTYE
jgi:IPT/TIG domain